MLSTWFLITYYGLMLPMPNEKVCLEARSNLGIVYKCINTQTGQLAKEE